MIINYIHNLEKLINDRTYITNLNISTNDNINHFLQYLTDLTHLELGWDFNQQIDLSKFTNLKYLNFSSTHYNYTTDLSQLINLTYLEFGTIYNQLTDLSQLTNLKYLEFGYHYDRATDLTNCPNLEYVCFGGCKNNLVCMNIEIIKNKVINNVSKYKNCVFKKLNYLHNNVF